MTTISCLGTRSNITMIWMVQCNLMPRCLPALEVAIKDVDGAFDSCNEAWARGEADKFRSNELLV